MYFKMSVGIYQWPESVLIDESTEEYEDFEYDPVSESLSTLNGRGEIRFDVDGVSAFLHPSKSYLYVKGQIKRTDNDLPFAIGDNVALANNGIAHLFSQVKYSISGQVTENVLDPGVASTMLGLLRYPDDFSKSEGMLQGWYKDSGNGRVTDVTNVGRKERKELLYNTRLGADQRGCFSFCIPLSHFFGFCEDYDKVIYGVTHSLSLFRQDDGYAIHRAANTANAGADIDAKVEIKKIKWVIPQIKPSLEIANGLIGEIEKKKIVQIGFKERKCEKKPVAEGTNWSWRLAVTTGAETPRFLILGFQIGDRITQVEPVADPPSETNASTFKNCKIDAIQIQMLGRFYPLQAQPIDFAYNDWAKAFKNAAEFRRLEALERLYRSTGLIFLQWQRKFLTIIIQSLHFSSLKKKGMEKTCEKRRKKW